MTEEETFAKQDTGLGGKMEVLQDRRLVFRCFRPCPVEEGQSSTGRLVIVLVLCRAWPHRERRTCFMVHPGHFCGGYRRGRGATAWSIVQRSGTQRGSCSGPSQAPLTSTPCHFSPRPVFWITGASIGARNSKRCDRLTGESNVFIGRSHKSLYPQVSPPVIYQVACWSADFTMSNQPINTGLAFINFKLVLMPFSYYLWKILKGVIEYGSR